MIYGLHISTGGKLAAAPARARAMGADVIQLFASNPRGWRPTIYSAEQAAAFRAACQEADIRQVFMHMIYLTSYGTPDDELRRKSITAYQQALITADQLGVEGVITHLGSHRGLTLEEAVERVVGALKECLEAGENSHLVLENSAGAGAIIGDTLEELQQIMEGLKWHPRVKLCLDTAHLLASGYEIRTREGWNRVIKQFEKLFGLDRLSAIHLNDSKIDLGGRVDRHENIGQGFIGEEGFRIILNHPRLKATPGILEVPGLEDKGPDVPNLEKLRSLTIS